MQIFEFLSGIKAPGPSRSKVQPLSLPLLEHLGNKLKTKELTKNEFLLKGGQTSKWVTFIESGLLRCYYISDSDKEVNRWLMRESDVVFSISSFFEQTPGQEFIQALEPTQLLYITYDELDEVYFKFPEFERIGRLLTIKYHVMWDQQLYSVLTKTARERFAWLAAHQHLTLKTSLPYIIIRQAIVPL